MPRRLLWQHPERGWLENRTRRQAARRATTAGTGLSARLLVLRLLVVRLVILRLLILRVLRSGHLHGYAIAQRIHSLSSDVLKVEEGALYPALQRMLLKGWVKAAPAVSETGRSVREYRLTPDGRKQLDMERAKYRRLSLAIAAAVSGNRC